MSLDLDAITARVDDTCDRYQIVLIDDFDALVGEVQRLRRALRKIDAADISCQTCLDIKAIAREALDESGGGETYITCRRPLVGQGEDTWDPYCMLPRGHEGECRAEEPGECWEVTPR